MKKKMFHKMALVSLLCTAPVHAALTLTVEVKDHGNQAVQTQTWKLDGSRFRTESTKNTAISSVIFDANAEKFLRINPAHKSYWAIDGRQIQDIELATKEGNAAEPRKPPEDARQFVPLNHARTIAGYTKETTP